MIRRVITGAALLAALAASSSSAPRAEPPAAASSQAAVPSGAVTVWCGPGDASGPCYGLPRPGDPGTWDTYGADGRRLGVMSR